MIAPAPHATRPPARVQIVAKEFRFILSRHKVKAGKVIVEFVNSGQDAHDLDIQRIGGTRVWHFPKVEPGHYVDRTLKLRPGKFRIWCDVPGHKEHGMHATFRVVR